MWAQLAGSSPYSAWFTVISACFPGTPRSVMQKMQNSFPLSIKLPVGSGAKRNALCKANRIASTAAPNAASQRAPRKVKEKSKSPAPSAAIPLSAKAEIMAAGLTVGELIPQDDSDKPENVVLETDPLPCVKDASVSSMGNGGGSPTFAQGGGKTTEKLPEIFKHIEKVLNNEA